MKGRLEKINETKTWFFEKRKLENIQPDIKEKKPKSIKS